MFENYNYNDLYIAIVEANSELIDFSLLDEEDIIYKRTIDNKDNTKKNMFGFVTLLRKVSENFYGAQYEDVRHITNKRVIEIKDYNNPVRKQNSDCGSLPIVDYMESLEKYHVCEPMRYTRRRSLLTFYKCRGKFQEENRRYL